MGQRLASTSLFSIYILHIMVLYIQYKQNCLGKSLRAPGWLHLWTSFHELVHGWTPLAFGSSSNMSHMTTWCWQSSAQSDAHFCQDTIFPAQVQVLDEELRRYMAQMITHPADLRCKVCWS